MLVKICRGIQMIDGFLNFPKKKPKEINEESAEYKLGRKRGYSAGFDDGYAIGHNEGYSEGRRDADDLRGDNLDDNER